MPSQQLFQTFSTKHWQSMKRHFWKWFYQIDMTRRSPNFFKKCRGCFWNIKNGNFWKFFRSILIFTPIKLISDSCHQKICCLSSDPHFQHFQLLWWGVKSNFNMMLHWSIMVCSSLANGWKNRYDYLNIVAYRVIQDDHYPMKSKTFEIF